MIQKGKNKNTKMNPEQEKQHSGKIRNFGNRVLDAFGVEEPGTHETSGVLSKQDAQQAYLAARDTTIEFSLSPEAASRANALGTNTDELHKTRATDITDRTVDAGSNSPHKESHPAGEMSLPGSTGPINQQALELNTDQRDQTL